MFDDARDPDDDETVTVTITTADGTTVIGLDPFNPVDITHVDGAAISWALPWHGYSSSAGFDDKTIQQ